MKRLIAAAALCLMPLTAPAPVLAQANCGLLAGGGEYTTRDLVVGAAVCAVNSCIAELRANGAQISCGQRVAPNGERRFYYRLKRMPENA